MSDRDRRYHLENRYQDSGWEPLGDDETFDDMVEALRRAESLSRNTMVYGMVKVVDREGLKKSYGDSIVMTFSGGMGLGRGETPGPDRQAEPSREVGSSVVEPQVLRTAETARPPTRAEKSAAWLACVSVVVGFVWGSVVALLAIAYAAGQVIYWLYRAMTTEAEEPADVPFGDEADWRCDYD